MHLKPSAGIFTVGFCLSVVGSGLILAGLRTSSALSSSNVSSVPDKLSMAMGPVGFVFVMVGVLLFFVAAHRALLKIDALPVALEPPRWPAPPEEPLTSISHR